MCITITMILIFFFLFKQKTAYEMRISDWSSDVCSSDLAGIATCPYNRYVGHRGPSAQCRRPLDVSSLAGSSGGARRGGSCMSDIVTVAIDATQIGRASCRERVCQYV